MASSTGYKRRLASVLVASLWLLGGVVGPAGAADTGEVMAAYKAYMAAYQAGDAEQALAEAERAYRLAEQVPQVPDRNRAVLAFNYGKMLRLMGEQDAAEAKLSESLDRFEAVAGKRAMEIVDPLIELALVEAARDKHMRAIRMYRRALRIVAKSEPPQPVLESDIRIELSRLYIRAQDAARARGEARAAERALARLDTPDPLRQGVIAFQKGYVEMSASRHKKAIPHLEESVRLMDASTADGHTFQLRARSFLIHAFEELGRSDEATEHCIAIGHLKQGRGDAEQEPLFKLMPNYPPVAASGGVEGYVIVEFDVTASGQTENVRVVEADPEGYFERSATEAAARFRYAPAIEHGQPVPIPGVQNLITYRLER